MRNIQPISDSYLCSNCGACKAICPKDAIILKSTSIGRLYAYVNKNCINCGLCTKVCPSIDFHNLHKIYNNKYIGEIKNVFTGISTDKTIYNNSQSGGACTAVITYLFDMKLIDGAIVCKMIKGNPPFARSYIVKSKEELLESQKSCYTPVELLSILKYTSNFKSLAIVGLPCHIQGVESLIKENKRFNNITYKLGLICDRTLCSTIQDVMLSFYPNMNSRIVWRKKNFTHNNIYYPYKTAPVVIETESNQYIISNIYRFALKEMFTPPRCRVCYDKLNTHADIVFGDPWDMSSIDWDKGESLIITRTNTGMDIINNMKKLNLLKIEEKRIEELINGQKISKRIEDVGSYAKLLNLLFPNIESYLLYQYDNSSINSSMKNKYDILKFIKLEKLNKQKIIKKSRAKIKKTILVNKLNRFKIYRAFAKCVDYCKRD